MISGGSWSPESLPLESRLRTLGCRRDNNTAACPALSHEIERWRSWKWVQDGNSNPESLHLDQVPLGHPVTWLPAILPPTKEQPLTLWNSFGPKLLPGQSCRPGASACPQGTALGPHFLWGSPACFFLQANFRGSPRARARPGLRTAEHLQADRPDPRMCVRLSLGRPCVGFPHARSWRARAPLPTPRWVFSWEGEEGRERGKRGRQGL